VSSQVHSTSGAETESVDASRFELDAIMALGAVPTSWTEAARAIISGRPRVGVAEGEQRDPSGIRPDASPRRSAQRRRVELDPGPNDDQEEEQWSGEDAGCNQPARGGDKGRSSSGHLVRVGLPRRRSAAHRGPAPADRCESRASRPIMSRSPVPTWNRPGVTLDDWLDQGCPSWRLSIGAVFEQAR
jgi:hypothetical protein